MNKTIFVIYTNTPVTKDRFCCFKKYVFNTHSDIREGDMIKSPSYDTPMQVTDVLSETFSLFDRSNGSLSNICTSTNQFPIRQLEIMGEPMADYLLSQFIGGEVINRIPEPEITKSSYKVNML